MRVCWGFLLIDQISYDVNCVAQTSTWYLAFQDSLGNLDGACLWTASLLITQDLPICYILWLVFSDFTGTTFLYKIVPSVNLQQIHKINIKYVVCNKTTTYKMWRTHLLFLLGISDLSSGLVRYASAKTTHVFSTDRLNTHLFLLYYHHNIIVQHVSKKIILFSIMLMFCKYTNNEFYIMCWLMGRHNELLMVWYGIGVQLNIRQLQPIWLTTLVYT